MCTYTVLRIDEQDYGCEELPDGQPVLCDVLLQDADGVRHTLAVPDAALYRNGIEEGCTVVVDALHELRRV
jgi:probable phosphoglycerate mutase